MSRLRLFQSTTFRLTVVYLCLFTTALLIVLGVVYWRVTESVSRQINVTIDTEITALAEQFNQRGLAGLRRAIARRSSANTYSGGLYLLVNRELQPLSGNLSSWPKVQPDADGWITFPLELPARDGSVLNYGRARLFDIGPYRLLVGHDIQERVQVAEAIRNGLVWALAAAIAISLLGGLLVSRQLFRQVDKINATSREIMAGDLTRRVELTGRGDEFDQLATNLNHMLDQIERLIDGMRQVSDNIAHDLRSPLARLRSRLEVTLMDRRSDQQYRSAIELTIEEADKLLATFNALLVIAQAESGAQRERFERVDLNGLAQDVAELYEPLAEDNGLIFQTDLNGPAEIWGDRELLFQALANLLDNAIKFSPPGGRVALSLSSTDREAVLQVSDQGPGVPVESREKVLKRFYRMEEARSTPGSGLGLSLVAAVVGLHGGRLSLGAAQTGDRPGLRVDLLLPRPGIRTAP